MKELISWEDKYTAKKGKFFIIVLLSLPHCSLYYEHYGKTYTYIFFISQFLVGLRRRVRTQNIRTRLDNNYQRNGGLQTSKIKKLSIVGRH